MNNTPQQLRKYRTLDGHDIKDVEYCPTHEIYTFASEDGSCYAMPKNVFEALVTEVTDGEPADAWLDRLIGETRETAERLNGLNAFMGSDKFPTLPREDKDLLYEQQRAMSIYVQILGKRIERANGQFTHNR